MSKCLVLASGGLDSTVLLYDCVKKYGKENVIAMGISYGQKHIKEQDYLAWTCKRLGVQIVKEDLSKVFTFSNSCSLLQNSRKEIPQGTYKEQKKQGTISTYVPFRNGLFLSYAASVALQLGCSEIYYGAHKDDCAGDAYPDCSQTFVTGMMLAIQEGTGGKVIVKAPWINYNKSDIVRTGLKIGMTQGDFLHTWSCYEGKEEPCKKCATCIDRKKAFEDNGIYDIW